MKNYLNLIRLALMLGAFTLCLSFTGINSLEKTDKEEITDEVSLEMIYNHGTWTTNLSGDNEVPSVDTAAFGKAIVTYRKDGNFYYRIILHNIDNVTGAHLHRENVGEDTGPIVVGLFAGGPTDTVNGNFISGSFSADLYPNLLQDINDGIVYVNVHTLDFRGGEVRGQL